MKLETSKRTVERGGSFSGDQKFTIEASAKAFEVLSSSLYKNAIRAICRELGTNAADAMTMAGRGSVPFEVGLPNDMSPWFYVKDTGVGLTPEQIQQVYTVYFKSDKTHSNEVTGCLGLGSKSPFSYTDQFTVTSVTGGVKRIYTAYIEPDHGPNITLMAEEPTKEPTGVEVKFSVKANDFSRFHEEAVNVYRFFEPKPTIPELTDADPHALDLPEVLLKGPDWAVIRKNSTCVVQMGNVGYPMTSSDIGYEFINSLHHASQAVFQLGTVIKVSIGDVDIVASRESLKFTDKTYKTIRERLAQIAVACREEAERAVGEAKTYWDARLLYRELKDSHYLSAIMKRDPPRWRGRDIDTQIKLTTKIPNSKKDPKDPDHEFMPDEIEIRRALAYHLHASRKRRRGSAVDEADGNRSEARSIDISHRTRLFINDLPKGGVGRIYERLADDPHGIDAYLIEASPAYDFAKFIKEEEVEHIISYTSKLPEVYRPKRTYRKTAQMLGLDTSECRTQRMWKEVSVELDGGGVYVNVRGFDWSAGTRSGGPHDLSNFLDAVEPIIGVGSKDIYGIRGEWRKRIEKHDKWVRLDEYVADKIKRAVAPRLTAAKIILYKRFVGRDPAGRAQILNFFDATGIDERSPLAKAGKAISDLRDATNDKSGSAMLALKQNLKDLNIELPDVSDIEKETMRLYKEAIQRYPLLPHINDSIRNKAAVVEYVNAMDRRRRRSGKSTPLQPA